MRKILILCCLVVLFSAGCRQDVVVQKGAACKCDPCKCCDACHGDSACCCKASPAK